MLNVSVNQKKPLLKNTQRCLNHVFLLEQQKNYLGGHCLDGHHVKKEELESVENNHKWFHKLCWNPCTWHGLDDLTSCGLSINWFVRLPNGLKNVTDDAKLISYIHHTQDYRQYCHVGNTAQHCPLALFQDSDFAGDLGRLEINIRWNFMFLEVEHSSLYIGMCKKQTAASHSSTESEIIPLDAGFSMKSLPASDLRDTVVQVLRSLQINMKPFIIASGNGSEISQVHQSNKREHPLAAGNGSVCNVDQLSQMDHVSSKAQYSQGIPSCTSSKITKRLSRW